MLFSGEEGLKPTEALSGGETARLLFCRIMLQKPNVLIFDEPTNHLDLESINALNIALQKFEGTVLLVTHDEDLADEVGTRIWSFDDGRIAKLLIGEERRVNPRLAGKSRDEFIALMDTLGSEPGARDALAPYKRIRLIEFSDLPKTISGKIRRNQLRKVEYDGASPEVTRGIEFNEKDVLG